VFATVTAKPAQASMTSSTAPELTRPFGRQKAKLFSISVDEGRKRVLLIAASILAARKLAQYDKARPAIEATIPVPLFTAQRADTRR
jgi:hypothetical protein